jgi:Rps23 Pro-64 3,4-dihydroxylase Tpa1-like proline 4-hydroxylase
MNSKIIENNYIVIPNFISKSRAKILYEEYKNYCKLNNILGDEQVIDSHSSYNYISFLELLCEKTQEVSSILEETVLPTYTYARVYRNKNELKRHTDRDACEISLTLHLHGDQPWKIYIKNPEGEEKSVILHSGDAMLYLGKTAEHWRNEYVGDEYTQVFLHYVRSRGECAYACFDKKNKDSLDRESESNHVDNKHENHVVNKHEEKLPLEIINENKECPSLQIEKNMNSNTSLSRSKLEDYIKVFNNMLPEEFCDEIIKEYKNTDEWQFSSISAEKQVNRNIRNCTSILISNHQLNSSIRKKIDESLFEYSGKCVKKYSDLFPNFQINIDTGYELLKYDTGGFYVQHTDSFKEQQRSVSCSFILNDDYSGGEFAFFNREMIIKAAKGSVIMFPSNFMYPHEIMPVSDGTRYSIITWFV